jgi:Ca2+-binding RTX toxin-like protein
MINVRATQQETERPARARYLFGDAERYSRLPMLLVLAIGSLVAYLKLAFPVRNEDYTPPHETTPADNSSDAPPSPIHPVLSSTRADDPTNTDDPEGDEAEAGRPVRVSDKSSAPVLFPSFSFGIEESAPIDFSTVRPTLPPPLRGLFTQPPGNDNEPIDATASAGSLPAASATDAAAGEPPAPETPAPGKRNRAPTSSGPVRLHDAFAGQVSLITLASLLLNTVDAEGDELSVSGVTASMGKISIDGGAWSYQAGFAAHGEVTLTFWVSDGQSASIQHATFLVSRDPLIPGTDGNDLLVGTTDDDEIDARGGDDIIDARAGDDVIAGGDGNDHIVAGSGNDTVFAGRGDDIVFAGEGNDTVWGGEGDEQLFGEAGDDLLDGEAGNDRLDGGDGDDILMGGLGNDDLVGDTGADLLNGGADNDILTGGEGNDILRGDADDDQLFGDAGDDLLDGGEGVDMVDAGAGDDVVVVSIDYDADAYEGGSGFDTLDLSLTTLGVEIDLVRGAIKGLEVGKDSISGFEAVSGGKGDDTFVVGGNVATVLRGGDGDDTFVFTAPGNAAPIDVIVNEILDLMVGDRIMVSSFELTQKQDEALDDRFDRAYAGRDETDNPYPIRIRYERYDDTDHTIIDVDFDGNAAYELSIDVEGTYRPFVYETA